MQVLKILHSYRHATSIFDDFSHYEKRQAEEDQRKTTVSSPGGGDNYENDRTPPPPPQQRERDRDSYRPQQSDRRDGGFERGNDRGNERDPRDFRARNPREGDRSAGYDNYRASLPAISRYNLFADLILSNRTATLAMDTICATGTTAGRTARPRLTITAAVIAAVETCVLAEARGTRRHCDCAYVVCVCEEKKQQPFKKKK